MMTRAQRIDYEILDCVLNDAVHSLGYISTLAEFMARLAQYFPDILPVEFMASCKRLTRADALEFRLLRGLDDVEEVHAIDFETALAKNPECQFHLRRASNSRKSFSELMNYIEAPPGFKLPGTRS